MDPEVAKIKKELGGLWKGSKGEFYEVMIEGGKTWKCIRRNEWGSASYTLRYDGRDIVVWGTAYTLSISELRRVPALATWNSSKGKRPFVWKRASKEDVAAQATAKSSTAAAAPTGSTAARSIAGTPSASTASSVAAAAVAVASVSASPPPPPPKAPPPASSPAAGTFPSTAASDTAAAKAAILSAIGGPTQKATSAAPAPVEAEDTSHADAAAAAAAKLLSRMTASQQSTPPPLPLPESVTSSSNSRKAANKITKPPKSLEEQDFDFLKQHFSGTWVGDRFETYDIELKDSDFEASSWRCVRTPAGSPPGTNLMTYTLYWHKEDRYIVWGSNYSLSIPDFRKNPAEPTWWSSKNKRSFVWWKQGSQWPPATSSPTVTATVEESQPSPALSPPPPTPALDDFLSPPGIPQPDDHGGRPDPRKDAPTSDAAATSIVASVSASAAAAAGAAAAAAAAAAAVAASSSCRGCSDGYPVQYGQWRLLPPPPVHAEVAPVPDFHAPLFYSKGLWNQGDCGTVF